MDLPATRRGDNWRILGVMGGLRFEQQPQEEHTDARNTDANADFRCTSATAKVRDGSFNCGVFFTLVPFMHVGSDRLNRRAVAR